MPRKPALNAPISTTKITKPAANSKAGPKEGPRPVAIAGLGHYIALARRVESLTAMRDERKAALLPKLLNMHRRANADAEKVADVTKSVPAFERAHGAAAAIQLASRKKEAGGLSEETIALLTSAKIPLKLEPARTVLNPRYAGFEDATSAKMAEAQIETARVISALARLVAAHPEAGIPADLFAQTTPRSLPGDDALFRALKLGDNAQALAVLPALVDVRVAGKQIDQDAYNKLLDGIDKDRSKDAEALAGKLKPSFEAGEGDGQAAPKPRRSKTPPVVVPAAVAARADRPAARRRA